MNKIALALAIARGEATIAQGEAALAKSIAPSDAATDLVKGDAKPPSGYAPVPGGAHGGYRKKTAKGWSYWYPDTTSARAASDHHGKEARAAQKRMNTHDKVAFDTAGLRHDGSGSATSHHHRVEAAAAKRERDEHAQHAAGAEAWLAKQSSMRRIMDQRTEDKKRQEESAKLPETAPEGQHYIAEGKGVKRAVQTIATHGLYAVHSDGGEKPSYTVTHTPTGMRAGTSSSKAKAIAHAKHFHQHAGDAGADAKFGEQPSKEALDRMMAAHKTAPPLSKSMADWQPLNAPPEPASLTKGFSDRAEINRAGVAQNAFADVPAPRLRKGGDVELRGIGAGFDGRWNGGAGFGG